MAQDSSLPERRGHSLSPEYRCVWRKPGSLSVRMGSWAVVLSTLWMEHSPGPVTTPVPTSGPGQDSRSRSKPDRPPGPVST